jgi:hypothetical protein
MSARCPLYPRKRTCAVQLPMSALGQKRTLDIPNSLPPTAHTTPGMLKHIKFQNDVYVTRPAPRGPRIFSTDQKLNGLRSGKYGAAAQRHSC